MVRLTRIYTRGGDKGLTSLGDNPFLAKKAQGQFVVVTMTVQNTSDEPKGVSPDNQKLFDSQGRKFTADTSAGLNLDTDVAFWDEINPGNAVTLKVVYDMPAGAPFAFDRSFDEKVGYRTKSMLVTPLTSSKGEVIGVLQLINKKREPKQKLLSPDDIERNVVPFDERSEELVKTLAAQAGIALENAILYDDIRKIFEGFVQASVDAIEARDADRAIALMLEHLAHVERELRLSERDRAEIDWDRMFG